jgi:hypothetical protein
MLPLRWGIAGSRQDCRRLYARLLASHRTSFAFRYRAAGATPSSRCNNSRHARREANSGTNWVRKKLAFRHRVAITTRDPCVVNFGCCPRIGRSEQLSRKRFPSCPAELPDRVCSAQAKRDMHHAGLAPEGQREPLCSNSSSIGVLSGKTSATNSWMPAPPAIAARWRSSTVPRPRPWYWSTTVKAASARPGCNMT